MNNVVTRELINVKVIVLRVLIVKKDLLLKYIFRHP